MLSRLFRLLPAVGLAVAALAALCTTAFAATPALTLAANEYEYGMTEQEFMELMNMVMNGLMWYFIVGLLVGVIAVVIGIVVIVMEKNKQKAQGYPPYGQYPPQYYTVGCYIKT